MTRISRKGVWDPTVKVESSAYNWTREPIVELPRCAGDPDSKLQLVDLFCGCGGFSSGFRMAGFKTALGVDIHVPSMMTFRHNHPESVTILGDIGAVRIEELSEIVDRHPISVVAAGSRPRSRW